MKIVVTGHKGFIGSIMCKLLKEQGHTVYGIDWHYRAPSHDYVDHEIHNNFTTLCDYLNVRDIDAVFHFAAYADVPDSVENPAKYYYNNTGNTAFLLDMLRYNKFKGAFIFSSTAAVYKEQLNDVAETSELLPPNPYGRSKLACEALLRDWHDASGLNVVMFRYFNVAGAYDDVGDHEEATHIIQRLCNADKYKEPFTVFGTKKLTKDGTCVRDYVHVLDVCRAHLHALKYVKKNPGCHTYNLGSNNGFTVEEVVSAFKRFTGSKINIVYNEAGRPGDPDYLVANNSKFINETGFKYEHTNLERIINSAWMNFNK